MSQIIVGARAAGSSDPAGRAHHVRRVAAAIILVAIGIGSVVAIGSLNGHRTAVASSVPQGRAVDPAGIAALQQRLREVPRDWNSWASLGSVYVQQARLSGDPTYYPKAEQALDRSLSLEHEGNTQAFIGMGSLAAGRHRFSAALVWGKRALAVDPYSAGAYGVIGDALIELGRYPAAFDALQHMVDLRPGLSSYARASYAWELQGNRTNAIRSLRLALQSAPTSADGAFASYYLGELYWNSGRIPEAARFYRRSAALSPPSITAQQGLAKVAAARGDLPGAISAYERIVANFPLPQYIVELADLFERAGRPARAEEQYAVLGVQEKLLKANGVNIDLEIAIFDADHGIHLAAGLAAARAEWVRRRSVFVADALAWSLYANHRYSEALPYARRALRLGTQNALFYFHKGMIEHALGDDAGAHADLSRAIAINPYFSFRWAPRARTLVDSSR